MSAKKLSVSEEEIEKFDKILEKTFGAKITLFMNENGDDYDLDEELKMEIIKRIKKEFIN